MTSVSLALSNFLCSKAGKKTAYIELNANNEICSLVKNCRIDSFPYMGITIFPHRTFTSLAEILHLDYDYFVLDMGVLNAYSAKEFAKFEKQFLVCSLSKWKRKKTIEKLSMLLETTHIPPEYVTIICNCSEKESKLKVSPTISFSVISVPFIHNPFQLDTDIFPLFGKITGQY